MWVIFTICTGMSNSVVYHGRVSVRRHQSGWCLSQTWSVYTEGRGEGGTLNRSPVVGLFLSVQCRCVTLHCGRLRRVYVRLCVCVVVSPCIVRVSVSEWSTWGDTWPVLLLFRLVLTCVDWLVCCCPHYHTPPLAVCTQDTTKMMSSNSGH